MSDLTTLLAQSITDQIAEGNALSERYAAATTNVNKAVKELREDPETTDETVKRYQEIEEKITAQLNANREKIDSYLAGKIGTLSDEEKEEIKSRHAAIREAVNSALKFLKSQPDSEALLTEIPALRNLSGRKAASGAGSSKRPRIESATVNGEDVFSTRTVKNDDGTEGEEKFVTFTVLAQHISKDAKVKVTPRMLQEAAFEAAKTDTLSEVREVSFGYSADGNNYDVTVFPTQPDSDED